MKLHRLSCESVWASCEGVGGKRVPLIVTGEFVCIGSWKTYFGTGKLSSLQSLQMLILEQTEIGQTHLSFWQTSSSAICTQETLISPHCTATALTLQELKRMLINTWFAFRRWSSHHRLKFYLPRKGRGQKTERSLPNIEMHPDFKMPPKYKFAEGEKVLCYHGPMLYEAKVTDS